MSPIGSDRVAFARRNWKATLSIVLLGLGVIATCIALRAWSGTSAANAQTGSPAPVRSSAGTSQVPPASAPRAAASQAPQGPLAPQQNQELQTVALVNGEAISRQQLANEAVRRFGKDVLESLVNKHLILQACQKQKISVTNQDVETEIERMSAKFGLSKDKWLEMLQGERNINPQQYRTDIIWPTLALRKLAADQITPTKEELTTAWESEFGAKVQVRMIMIKDKARCEQVHKYCLAKPNEFETVAKDYSEDQASASARGLVPPIRKHVGQPAIEKVVFNLKEKEISPVVEAAGQHFFFKCEQHLPETVVPPQLKTDAESKLRERLVDQKLRSAATDLFKKLQDEAQVVNVFNQPALSQQMPGVAATINGQKLTMRALSDECIARHGGEVLEGEINRVLLTQALKKSNATVTQQDIDAEVARAAEMYGFVKADGSPDIEAWLKKVIEEDNATVELYVHDAVWPSVALKKLVSANVQITQEDLQKAYEANYGEQVEVLVCVLNTQRRAQEVWEMARDNPTDKYFGDLAHQYSIEPTSKYNFGKVPPIRMHSGQPAIEKEAFGLKVGELSGIVALGDKFLVMRCVGRMKPDAPELAVVKDELFKDLQEKKMRIAMGTRFDNLREAANIENFLVGTSQPGKVPGATGVRPASATGPVNQAGRPVPPRSATVPAAPRR